MEIKTFDGFIKELTLEPGCVYEFNQCRMLENFGDFCYDEMIDNTFNINGFNIKCSPKDIIEENLKSHDWKLLRKQLFKLFQDDVLGVGIDSKIDNGELSYVIIKAKDAEKLKANEKFNELLLFFNYFVTQTTKNDIYLEPKYSAKINLDCEYVYHLTQKKNLESIHKKGLVCKCGEMSWDPNKYRNVVMMYRNFPKRIYLFSVKNETKDDFFSAVCSLNINKDAVILKIKNSKNITLYKDVAYDKNENMFFTYDNIPPQLIVDEISLF